MAKVLLPISNKLKAIQPSYFRNAMKKVIFIRIQNHIHNSSDTTPYNIISNDKCYYKISAYIQALMSKLSCSWILSCITKPAQSPYIIKFTSENGKGGNQVVKIKEFTAAKDLQKTLICTPRNRYNSIVKYRKNQSSIR